MGSTSEILAGNARLLKSKASKYSIVGVGIPVRAIVIASIMAGYLHTNQFSLESVF